MNHAFAIDTPLDKQAYSTCTPGSGMVRIACETMTPIGHTKPGCDAEQEAIMGKSYTVNFADGTGRSVASFSQNRAELFYEMAKLLEQYVDKECGIEPDIGLDDHEVDGDKFVAFFERFWQLGWLADIENSFAAGWAPWAAGIVENITLEPKVWIDRQGNRLQVRRYLLNDRKLEDVLNRKIEAGDVEVRKSEINNTDITV